MSLGPDSESERNETFSMRCEKKLFFLMSIEEVSYRVIGCVVDSQRLL